MGVGRGEKEWGKMGERELMGGEGEAKVGEEEKGAVGEGEGQRREDGGSPGQRGERGRG